MFGIGLPEMIVIMAVALIVVGPDKLPELARSLAKGIGELKKTMNQVKENLSEETKVISSVQEDLQKTAGKLTSTLIDDESKIWRPENDPPEPESTDEIDVIDLQPLEERPWEKDAGSAPENTTDEHNDDTKQATPSLESAVTGKNSVPDSPQNNDQNSDKPADSPKDTSSPAV